jgi:hypothetical protein
MRNVEKTETGATSFAQTPFGRLTFSRETFNELTCGLYYNHVTIVNYASSSVNKLRASLNDVARVVIYDFHTFIVQATVLDPDQGTLKGEVSLYH